MFTPARSAAPDPALRARVVHRSWLRYAAGPALSHRPAHVRAASALVPFAGGHVVVQDDALYLGWLADGRVTALPLPAPDGERLFDEGRGNKHLKPDLEAACPWPTPSGDVLVAFGSGSTPRRERLLVADAAPRGPDGARFVDAPELYAALRARLGAGVDLNVEGALRVAGGRLRLLQRGNGAGRVDAALDLDGSWLDAVLAGGDPAPPRVLDAVRWSLGDLGGVGLTFTDGAPLSGDVWLFSAAAEASPDAVADGPVAGSAIGWADTRGSRWAPLIGPDDRPLPIKLEGITLVEPGLVWGVVDADDPDAPSELLHVRLDGPWPGLPGWAPDRP